MLSEHEQVVLTIDLPEHRLKAGDVGTIVHVYSTGKAYEVEFFMMDGNTLDVVTVEAHQIRAVSGDEVLHVRQLS